MQKLQKMCYHIFIKTFIKLPLLFVTVSSVSYSHELPKSLIEDTAKLLEKTMQEELNFESEKWLTGKIEKESQYKGVIELKKYLIESIFDSIPQKIFEDLEIKNISSLSSIHKEALALFSTQFEGGKIEIEKIKSPRLLAASLNVLSTDKGIFSEKILKKFISYIPSKFLEDSDY